MSARTNAPRWSAVVIALSVALLALGFAPSAKATNSFTELWVASDSTITPTPPGTSCANPGYFNVGHAESAIKSAIDDAAAGATIHLCSGIYTMTNVDLVEQPNLSIVGAGPATTFVVGFRNTPFFASTGNLTVSGVTFMGGYNAGAEGGAVSAAGTLTIDNAHFNTNYSEKGGGAVAGGVAVVVDHSSFYNNTTHDQGGAIASFGVVTVSESVFTANQSIADLACIGGGGAIAAADDVHVTGSRFTNNAALLTTGDSCNQDAYNAPYGGKGGAIASLGYVWATDTTFTSNRATIAGGAVAELVPAAITRVDVGGSYIRATFTNNEASGVAGGAILVHGTTTVTSSLFQGNRTGLYGGSAIYSLDDGVSVLNISRSTFSKNIVTQLLPNCSGPCSAGAVSGSTVNVTMSNFNGNTGGAYGGAIGGGTVRATYSVFTNNRARWSGGAITANVLVVKHSEFTSNTVVDSYGAAFAAHGGGALFVCQSLVVDYSRFTGNSVKSVNPAAGFWGAGGAIGGYGTSATISHSWFVRNTASGRGGAINLGTDTSGPVSGGGAMAVTLTRNRFNYNVAGSYGGAVELGGTTAAALLGSKYNSFVGNRAGTGGSIISVFAAGGITQANLNRFGINNPHSGNRGPGKSLLLIAVPI